MLKCSWEEFVRAPTPRNAMTPMWKRMLAALAAFTLIFVPTIACGEGGDGGEDTEEEDD